jgi:adenosylcobinamide-GDP ribazoletransferase
MDSAVARPRLAELAQLPLVALETLTILRLRRPPVVSQAAFGQSQAFFPLAGFLLGGALAGASWLAYQELGGGVTGWLLMGLLLLLTGGLHADGLADTADGLFGGATPERRLAIMRDSSIGAFGAVALVLVLGLKAATLGSVAGISRPEMLVVAPALSRWACVAAIAAYANARPDGLGAAFHAAALPWAAPLAAAICLAGCVAALGLDGALAWLLAAASGLALGGFIASRIGGLTGDSFGAVIEVTETAVLVAAVAWLA